MEAEVDGALELQMRSLQLHESAQENLLQAQNLINRVCLGDAGDHFEEQHLIRCQFIAGFENEKTQQIFCENFGLFFEKRLREINVFVIRYKIHFLTLL